MITTQAGRTKIRQLEIIIFMGALQAFAPLSIDMYLPSLPLLERVFGATTAEVQRTLATFFLGFALGQSLYGPITDRFGRKPPLYFSLLLFVASSVACAMAPTIQALAVFRLLQALGACGGAVIARAMARDLFPPSELRRVFSMLMLVMGVSPIAAPLIGGYVLLWFGWAAIFWTHALLGAACLVGIHFRLPESLAPGDARPLRARHILDGYSQLFRDRTFLGASLVCGFSSAGMFAYIASAPFVFITLYKVPAQQFGWLFGAIAAGVITASQVNGRMLHGVPLWRVLRVANLVQLVAGLLLLTTVLTGTGGLLGVFVPVFFYVASNGFVFPNGSAIAMMRHGKVAGMASALLGTNQFVLAAIATIALGSIPTSTALPMALVIAGCGLAATLLNFLTLGAKLEALAESFDADAVWPKILDALASGNTGLAHTLLWPPGAPQAWYEAMAPRMENAGGGFEKSDRALAIFCYEQARNLYQADSAGATSGGEGLAGMSEMRGSHLGRKIWLLKT